MYKCNCCGKELRWMCDLDAEEVYPDNEFIGDIVEIHTCDNCSLDYEIMPIQTENGTQLEIKVYEREY